MQNRAQIFSAFVALVCLSGCTNWMIRQECGKVNWYQHGYDAAMSGRRLTGDPMAERCRRADFDLPEQEFDVGFKAGMANYCKPEIVFTTGKKGDLFNTDMCDPGQANFLRSKHAEGVKAYCAAGNGFNAGSSGKKYQNICPPEMEKKFLPEYKRGRKSYLLAKIGAGEKEAAEMDTRVRSLENQRQHLSFRRSALPGPRYVNKPVYKPETGQYVTESVLEDNWAFQRSQLDDEMRTVTAQISEIQTKREALRQRISEDRIELASLD